MRIAATADIHVSRTPTESLQPLFAGASREAEVLLLCGDLTDYGLAEEAHLLAEGMAEHAEIPVLAVLGNHDFESAREEEVVEILCDAGMILLDGEACVVDGVGFAGVKGFGGGFGDRALSPWGEKVIKEFAQEAVDEALKLEAALSRLDCERRVVLLHYAPIVDTVEGEPPEIFPFLGSSRLEQVLDRFGVDLALHGHAHRGAHRGRTEGGVEVVNVSLPVLREEKPGSPPYLVLEV